MNKEQGKPKILYVITKSNFGGAQRYVFELARAFHAKYDVGVVVGGSGALTEKLAREEITTHSIETLQRDISIFKEIRSFASILSLFRREKPDIIHLNSSKAGLIGAFAGRLTGVPKIVFTGHGWAFNEDRPLAAKIFFGTLHWLTIILAHKTIAVSEKTARQLAVLPGVKHKITVVYNGIAPFELYSRTEARRELGKYSAALKDSLVRHEDEPVIGTVAELHKNKGVDIFIDAMRRADGLGVVISGGDEYEALQQRIENTGLEKRVFLLGQIPDARMLLRAFDIFVLPSRTEAFPYALLEAGSANLPVVATRVGGVPEIIDDSKTGILVPKEAPEIMAHAINRLIHEPDLSKQLAETLAQRVRERFGFARMCDETQALYQDM